MDCTATVHGTANAHRKHGCTCADARRDYLRQHKRTRIRTAREGKLLVDKTGTLRRVRALQAAGWPLRRVLREGGWSGTSGALTFLYDDTRTWVHVDTARRIAAVYDRLVHLDGPDIRSARSAERAGFPPPWGWEGLDIDNPATEPHRAQTTRGRQVVWDEARVQEVAFLRSCGLSDEEIAARWGITPASLTRCLRRSPATLAG